MSAAEVADFLIHPTILISSVVRSFSELARQKASVELTNSRGAIRAGADSGRGDSPEVVAARPLTLDGFADSVDILPLSDRR
jgi:hypothetical protein